MLYFIGLGLYDYKDISLKGLEALKEVDVVYAEFFTSCLFGSNLSDLEVLIGKKVNILVREEVEEENIHLKEAEKKDVALICAGDPLIATTHADFLVEAKKRGIETTIIHSSSILSSAPGISGLQAYKFGKVTTIPFPDENFFPHSPYTSIVNNLKNDSHTLVLLDIRAHEDRYMTINQALDYLMIVSSQKEDNIINEETLAIALARVGSKEPLIRADKIKNLINEDFGSPLHSLIIPSKLHIVEAEYLVEVAGAPEELLDEVL